ncbi:MAG: hypothetical protein H7A45_13005 [Verrucomicrobiales bacterium]|nr:hypothetical protein [Verrucomicrobiales bacterium]
MTEPLLDRPDFFARLDEPRRPWIDPEALKERFIALSAPSHPDRVHAAPEAERQAATERFAALNEAYRQLAGVKDRLAHLLALERGAPAADVQQIPPGTMDLFLEVGQACRDVDGFLRRRDEATSPMVRVTLFEQGLDWTGRLQALQANVGARRGEIEAELQAMNAVWDSAPPPGSPQRAAGLPLERLEQLHRIYSYLARWGGQLQERLARLALP